MGNRCRLWTAICHASSKWCGYPGLRAHNPFTSPIIQRSRRTYNCGVKQAPHLCPSGTFGLKCERECPQGFYGEQCILKCSCSHDNCHPVQGCVTDNERSTSSNRSMTVVSSSLTVTSSSDITAIIVASVVCLTVIVIAAMLIFKFKKSNGVPTLRRQRKQTTGLRKQKGVEGKSCTILSDGNTYDSIRESDMIQGNMTDENKLVSCKMKQEESIGSEQIAPRRGNDDNMRGKRVLQDSNSCPAGTFGRGCAQTCPRLYYGTHCNKMCNCSEEECNPVKGCAGHIETSIRYARASTKYTDFVLRARRLSDKLLSKGCVSDRLTSSLRKFYGRYGELVMHYDVPLSRMVDDILS
ncbi:hypothetical protein FSP39_018399 [Pinctada imbricata]|uniref:Uncharacterized protein n=1 Tax=Pinctada imbricata TaxID=66713 RepID=A0AA89BRI4_PINIB|nr:hypothetical protein FSP39_018399 [Pinctada imbricata]